MKPLSALFVVCLSLSLYAETQPAATVQIDTSDAPELQAWAARAKKEIEAFYPTLAKKLGLDAAPRTFELVVKKDVKGSGSVAGSKVILGADYYASRPDEIGTVVFLITRGLQNYSGRDNPNWLVTGIADFIRWQAFEPAERRRAVNPRSAKYTNGFGDAAAFLAWLESSHEGLVGKVHTAMTKGAYSEAAFKENAGKELPALWADFLVHLRQKSDADAMKAVDKSIPSPKPVSASVKFTDVGAVEFAAPEKGHILRYTLDGSFPTAQSRAATGPVRVASSLKLRAAYYNAEGKCSEAVDVECVSEGRGDKPTAAINIDCSDSPEMEAWAIKAQKEAADYYATILSMLKSDGFEPSRQIWFVFKEEAKGLGPGIPAYAIGPESTIYFRAEHIRKNPNDFGMAIHELVHIIQNYGYSRNTPSWLVEGIADYVRWENWEPVGKRRRVDPLRAKYTNGYSDTARFLSWIEKNHDKEIVLKLNAALRKGAYKDELFKTYAGKDIPELWKDFTASLTK